MNLANSPLNRLTAIDQLATLEALEKKRIKDTFIRYWEPQAQQKEHFKKFTKEVKVFGILGGNRSGKTEEGVFIDVVWALGKDFFKGEPVYEYIKDLPIPEPPNNIWIVGLSYDVLKNVIWWEKLKQGRSHPAFLPRDPSIVAKVVDGEFQVFFSNGSIITGKSAEAGREKFQGASVDLVHIDEECEGGVFDECYQRTVDCGGKLLLTLTPLVDISSGVTEPWVFDLYEESEHGRSDTVFVKLSVLDNPYVPAEEKVKLQEKWAGHPEERARLYGDFIQRSGLVYPQFDKLKHIVDFRELPAEWRTLVSIDPAATGVTAALWAKVEPVTNNLYIFQEYYKNNLIVSEHCKNILAMSGGRIVDIWLLDPTWGGQRNAESHKTGLQLYRDSGLPCRLPDVGDDFGLNVSREYFSATLDPNSRHPKLYIMKNCKNLLWEISHYVWDSFARGDQKGQAKDKPKKRADHACNALQYLCSQRPKSKAMYNPYAATLEDKKKFAELNSY